MKVKFNSAKLLVNVLFILLAMLVGAIGLRMGLDVSTVTVVFRIGWIFGLISAIVLTVGIIYPIVNKAKKGNPSKIRQKLTDSFDFAESHPNKFIMRIKAKNILFSLYFLFVSVIGATFFVCVAICFFIKPITMLCFPLVFIAVVPIRKAIEFLLKKDSSLLNDGGIKKDEFPNVYKFFKDIINEELNDSYTLSLDFGSQHTLNVSLVAKTLVVNLNSYAFMLFNQEELRALFIRELRALNDKKCQSVSRVLKSRALYLSGYPTGFIYSSYFSFVITDTVTNFDFSKNALKRILERRKDNLITEQALKENYLRAYKKQCVLDAYFGDARSFITLNICQRDGALREFVSSVYNLFLELSKTYGKEWENEVERKLKAKVCSSLTYSEKKDILGVDVNCGEFINNCTEEQKTVYDKYNAEYYESTKRAHDPKKRAIDGYYRDIEHYEQNPSEYDERLKLIGIAHAYYMTAQLEKAEDVYNKILESGDSTSETCFDYGCFLLLAKKDTKGIEFIYKAMENENVVEEGFDVLGRHFITSGDEEGYKAFCDYKAKKLDEIVNGFKSRALDVSAKFVKTSLNEAVLSEITEKLVKDDNLEEIYCADSKTKSGSKIIVFAISVRNKTQEALYETYERVFSILDNDYGEYDTFLILLDAEPNKKLVEAVKKDGNYLIFKR